MTTMTHDHRSNHWNGLKANKVADSHLQVSLNLGTFIVSRSESFHFLKSQIQSSQQTKHPAGEPTETFHLCTAKH